MSELIDRQAVLDALIFDVRAGRQNGKTLMVRYAEEVIKRIKELPSAQRWIPTSVKPPEPFKLVLIQDYCGCYELNTYIPPRINPKQYPNGYWGEVGNVDFDYFDVEAWCPLPAPYCPEGEEHERFD